MFAMLGLLILGLIAYSQVEAAKLKQRQDAGHAEATVMLNLARATNNLIFENFNAIQAGNPVVKLGVAVTPRLIGGELVWAVDITDLVRMGFLPAGWSSSTSVMTGGAYGIQFARAPAGCVGAACNIEGAVINLAASLSEFKSGTTDASAIGSFLSEVGADAGVSLQGSSNTLTGFNYTWTAPNPVPGSPAGVLGIRVGSGSAGWGQFVRIGDSRDPSLNGNLTVAGNGAYGGNLSVAGTTALSGAVTVNNASLTLRDASATACVELLASGQININCNGRLNANTGVFTDGAGNTSQIGPGGVVTTGRVRAADGFEGASGNTAFTAADPNAITVAAGDLFVRGPSGMLLRVTSAGDALASRDLVATNNVAGRRVSLKDSVVEGAACAGTSGPLAVGIEMAALTTGGLATCTAGRWVAISRNAVANTPCGTPGAIATDSASGASVICRGGVWLPTNSLMSSFVLMATTRVSHGSAVAPPSCPGGAAARAEALLILTPTNDGVPINGVYMNSVNRYADAGWVVHIEMGDGTPISESTAIAHSYCWYPVS